MDRINSLKMVDYRYARFVLDYNTGLFNMLRFVRLPSKVDIDAEHPITENGQIRHGQR